MIDMEENSGDHRDGTTSGFAGYKHETEERRRASLLGEVCMLHI